MSPPINESGPARGATPETGPSEKFGSYLNAPTCDVTGHASGAGDATGLLELIGVTEEEISPETEDRASAAVSYAGSGLPVISLHGTESDGLCTCRRPDCESPGKHPRSTHGLNDATTDPELVATWWLRRPNSNVGVRPIPGTVVVDVDPRNGGVDSLAALLREHGPLPRTLTAETGSGGLHLWFGFQGTPPGKLGAGLDLKSASGYLVAPPSVHACGGRYRWVTSTRIASAPSWLRARMAPARRARIRSHRSAGTASLSGLVRFVEQSVEGERNRRLYWAACRAAEKGLDPADLIEAAVETGLEPLAAERTVESAGRRVEREACR